MFFLGEGLGVSKGTIMMKFGMGLESHFGYATLFQKVSRYFLPGFRVGSILLLTFWLFQEVQVVSIPKVLSPQNHIERGGGLLIIRLCHPFHFFLKKTL